jgi:hypothetical protein
VLIVTVDDPDATPACIVPGENEQAALAGNPEQDRLIALLRLLPSAETVIVDRAELPAFTVALAGDAETVKSVMPNPVRLAEAGPPLLEITTVPFRVPLEVGVKVRLMEQLAPAATDAGQLLVWAKSPETLIPLT